MSDNGIELNTIVNEFPERQHTFQRHKILHGKKSCNTATNPECTTANNIVVSFSYSIFNFSINNF